MDAPPPLPQAYRWLDLSAAQRAVWLDLQLAAAPLGYQLGGWARIDTALDLDLARQAVSLVMARHDALRLRIDPREPRQRLDASVAPPVEIAEISDAADPDLAFQAFAARAFSSTLPLGDAPLFRVDLLRAGPRHWYALWRCHHLIADATSVAIALRLWVEAYGALRGEADGEVSPPSSFTASLAADAAYQASAQCDADLAYWRSRFADPPEPLFTPLPPAPAAPPERWRIAGADYTGFVAACRACGVTTQRGLLAVLALLLGRFYGRADIAIGLALHRRDYASRDVVGMLAGLLPMRCAVDPAASMGAAVQAIGAAVDRDFRHQRVALDALRRALGGAAGPLFDVVLSHLIDEQPPSQRGGIYRGPEMMPLALYATERPRAAAIAFELAANPGFVDAATCRRLADALRRALAGFVADPYQAVDDLDPLGEDRALVVEAWNATHAVFPSGSLPALFAARVARTPDAEAVVEGARALSYEALDAASDALAAALQARGVGIETVVGVALHRSLETVVAALAVLKAGGVYLPLDPAYPPPRLAFMLRDAGAALVLTDADLAALLPDDVPRLDDLASVADAKPSPVALRPGHLAYIVYTSGSTGTPKGVAVSHASAANLAFARVAGHDPIGPGDRVLAAISVGFDVSIGQLLLPLLAGACVVIAPDLRTLSAASFWALLAEQRVSHVNSVPSFLDSVLDGAAGARLTRLMLGGEVLTGALCARLRAALPGTLLVNMYGPTEACIDATAYPVPDDAADGPLPIGRPLANYRAYVLDARRRPVPPGVAGELYLGGAGLARGYVGQPGLTAERFVADPFGAPGGRLYRTGDRARWRGDGTLAFLGRDDQQVKIRGFRVEPGEIEAALRAHPAVAQAAVIAQDGNRLIAYVVTHATVEPDALRAHLAARLPAHMIPATFVPLDALPLTPNGKLDRAALPAPADTAPRHVAPGTPLQAQVADMFARLLGVSPIGATDDFFELGGHSLLATRLVSLIRAECDIDLPLRAVFAAPTVAALAAVLAGGTDGPSVPPLRPVERPDPLPLSFAQERLWVLDQLDPGSSAYVIPAAVQMTGPLGAAALAAALQRVVDRHESLRTRFATRDGRAEQVIEPQVAIRLDHHDLAALAPDAQTEAVRDHLAAAERTPFVMARTPPLRASLLRCGPQDHVLVLAVHHIVADGWSLAVLLRELTTLYAAFAAGAPDPLPPLPIQYADFTLWQRGWLTGEVLARQLAYWRTALAGAPAQLTLPLDRPRPAMASLRGAMVPWRCPPALTARLQARAREAGATLFMLLLTAFQALLARWSGVTDIVVGTPIAQRTRAETEPLIGFFVNTLALRADCAGRRSFANLLAQARESTLAAYAHQDLPFERLVEALRPERDLARQPIVQAMFVLQTQMPPIAVPGLRLTPLDMPVTVAKFDLTLSVAEADGLVGGFEYATDLFDAATIERVGHWFTRLLTVIADDPARTLEAFDPLGEDRALVVEAWNATHAVFPSGSLPALFAARVARTPDAEAVVEGARALSYAALDAASDALAAALQARGVGIGTVVGVALHRSLETVVAALAVLKAGGVYLPLDPAYPPPRLAFMLRDAGAALVLTDADLAARLPDDVPRLDDLASVADAKPSPVALRPGHLAYIVYTSGSTGTPKGVAVSHASAVNLAFARRTGHDPIGPGDRVLAAISVGFDVSIGQLLLPLLSGACVVIAPDLRTLSAAAFWALLAEQRVSHVNSVPSFLDSVLDGAAGARLTRLMLGGEVLTGALCARLRAALPGTLLVNMYGPTEACIDATAYPVPDDAADGPLPIGRPLANYRAYVLDARRRPVPPGVAGELYLGGAGLARGYVGQPGLTAERFVADPFGAPGGRLYRTGDRARWRGDGTLAFLGRDDQQVKIRGFRVEPGEIEAALRAHPAVAQAAVVTQGGTKLIAYVVTHGAIEPDTLRAHLAARLPAHMIPAAFVPLDALPLTANGKLDRAALPAPPLSERDADAAPVGAREALLCALFAELTGAAAVGRHDGFFSLGGDSIGAIRLVSLARARGGLAIAVRDVFAHPTPAALALVARAADAEAAQETPATGPLPPTPLQQALLAAGAPIARFHQAVALHPPAGLDPARVAAALALLAQAHPALRLMRDGAALAIPDAAPPPTLHRIARADLPARIVALAEAFDLTAGVAVAALWTEDGDPPVLVVAIHHFAVDGVSWRILLDDLAALCAAEDPARVALPPSLPLRAWTTHLHREAARRTPELPLWQAMLAPGGIALPFDRPGGGANTIGAARALTRVLPPASVATLLAAPPVYRAEINDLLLAALGLAQAAWHRGHPVHVVAVEGHGREAGDSGLDPSRTVGWFTTLFPVRLDMRGLDLADPRAPGEAIKRVKATLRRLPDHGLGYGLLRHLNPETGAVLAALPQPALLFNYLGRFAHAAATGPQQWRPAPLPCAPADDAERTRDPVVLEANALLDGEGALHVVWTYAPDRFDAATVAALADGFLTALEAVARHCLDFPLPPPDRLIPADFPLAAAAGLDAEVLAALIAEVPDLETVLPLTPLQQGLVFESLLRRADDPYHVQGVLRLEGAIDVEALRAGWLALLRRHDVLRIALPQAGLAVGLGVLRPAEASLDWRVLDWRARDEAAAEQALADLAAADRAAGFDLARGGLFRLTLIRRGAGRVWLLTSNHHALLDGWSMPVLIGELFGLARGAALPPTLPWERFLGWLAGADRAEAAAFWAARFAGVAADAGALAPPPPDAPMQGTGEAVRELGAAAAAALEAFARRHGVTLATVALGAWALLLRPLRAAVAELVLGVTSGGRPASLPGAEHAVGLFIQTLPLRVPMAGALVPWLHALQSALRAQEAHGWLGLPAIRRAAGLAGDRAPFAALFVFENYPADPEAGRGDAPIRLVGAAGRDATHYPLALAAAPSPTGLRLRLTFDRRVIDADDAAALLGRLPTLLASVAASAPATPLADLPLLGEAELAAVLAHAGGVARAFPSGPLPALFAAQVARTPDAEAVVEGARALSYTALDAPSDALAAALQARGVGIETVVGVALHRSLETVVAALAVLKAGGVYLPLDPAYPPPRLAFMLRDAGAALVLTDADLAARLPDDVPRLDDLAGVPDAKPSPVALRPGHLAYIVYTSGSTGTPKGVAVSHASAVNLAFARRTGHDPIGPGDRVLAAISVGFDVSIGQLLLPLLSGACVVIAPDLRTLSAAAFWALLAEQRVSHVNSVPSFLDSVLDGAAGARLTRLMLGGEVLTGALCARLRAALPGTLLVNMYGPTEACIDATAYPVPDDITADGPLPIGRPLANYRAYVLDARRRPVPPGVAGELYLGGAGLARGYVGQPGLTAERFVADPFGAPGGRLYRTGDRARWRGDGTLAFLGRDDQQVKIRGFRVEPGEIEAALRAHPAVAQAAVIAQDGNRLIAYVVTHATVEPDALRAHLAARLPAHMIPATFVPLDALPLTPNGKLDRAALPASDAGDGNAAMPPRDDTELRLLLLWQEVLGVAPIGVRDDFFELGGDSLRGIRLLGACNAAFATSLPVASVFAHRTVAAMAAAIRQSGGGTARLVTLRTGDADIAPLICVHPQGGTVFCYAAMAAHLPPGLPVLGLQAAGLDAGDVPAASVTAMAADYLVAVRAVQPAGPYRLLGYSFGGLVAFEMARHLHAAGETVAFLGLLDTSKPGAAGGRSASREDVLAMLAEDIGLPPDAAKPRDTEALFAAAVSAGLAPPDVSLAQAERIVAVYLNNAEIADRYRPDGGLPAPVLQICAARRDPQAEPKPDWSALVTGVVTTVDFDCTHRGLIAPAMAPYLAAAVARGLSHPESPHG